MTAIEWRPVLNHEGYEVSSAGLVRSLASGVELHTRLHRNYPSIFISRRSTYVHRLVCEAWHGPRPEGMVCRHLDGNALNNTPENLAWGTAAENVMDTVRHGTHWQVVKTHCAQGHPFNEENTYRTPNGRRRVCRTCNRNAVARYAAKRVAA